MKIADVSKEQIPTIEIVVQAIISKARLDGR